MSVADEISRIKGNIASAYTAAGGKGATMPSVQNSANLAGCIDTITGGGGEVVDKTKFGVSIDDILGDVDADGLYSRPTEPFGAVLAGVKIVNNAAFAYKFYGTKLNNVVANDLVSVKTNGFYYAFVACSDGLVARFNGIEEITGEYSFYYAFSSTRDSDVVFAKLKKVNAISAFSNAFSSRNKTIDPDYVFPALEEIAGNSSFASFTDYQKDVVLRFSNVKKITGSSSQYSSTFGSLYYQNTKWFFPNATEFTRYIWNISSSYVGEIHFAVANQSAIEACDGYDKKWGFAGATIYFDL